MAQNSKKPIKKLKCPYCDKTFQAPQGLASHIRANHADDPPKATPPSAIEQKQGTAAPIPVSATPNTNALEHLKAALESLTQREHQIDSELIHLQALQAEKENIRKETDAVNTAIQAFR